jgi:hypothetical protein
MSAFVVSHDHIDALLTFARQEKLQDRLAHRLGKSERAICDFDEIGRVLLTENVRSVLYRYPDSTEDDAPGKTGERADGYRFKTYEPFVHMPAGKKAAWVIKACHCFDYQSCETEDYEASVAHGMIREIEAAAVRTLPHYEDAPWGIDRNR